jgi:hypothetical protein
MEDEVCWGIWYGGLAPGQSLVGAATEQAALQQ